jgi:hypothetical protein
MLIAVVISERSHDRFKVYELVVSEKNVAGLRPANW